MTGETDTTPVGAMGKITQLIFGVVSPGNTTVNLMSANVTAAAGSSADLLTDLKSGYLLGAPSGLGARPGAGATAERTLTPAANAGV